ncbi:MAG: hypothetical protein QXP58_04420, partial [Thermoprotei archaeon]
MESIKSLRDNPQLAKELAETLLPYIVANEEYKFVLEARTKLNTLIEGINKLQDVVNKNSEDIKLLHEDNKKIWEAINKNSEETKQLQ